VVRALGGLDCNGQCTKELLFFTIRPLTDHPTQTNPTKTTQNRQLLLADENEQLRITSTGLKIFERHELKSHAKPAAGEAGEAGAAAAAAAGGGGGGGERVVNKTGHYRLVQEGLPFVLPHITKQAGFFGGCIDCCCRCCCLKLSPPPTFHPPNK
jgi:hypothetical protein